MKPRDIEIVQSVLEITGPISPTEVYDKAKELFERGEITKMFDYGGNTPDRSVSAFIYTALNKGEELPFLKTQEKPVLNMEKISAPSTKIAHNKIMHERDLHPFLTYLMRLKRKRSYTLTHRFLFKNEILKTL